MKLRYGRGFTLEEIKAAGLNPKFARTIGISIDPRRLDNSIEAKEQNVKRLKTYLSKLILFPSKTSKDLAKKKEVKARKQIVPEAPADTLKNAKQVDTKEVLPADTVKKSEAPLDVSKEMKDAKAFCRLRRERVTAKYFGKRKKKAELAAKEAEDKAGKVPKPAATAA